MENNYFIGRGVDVSKVHYLKEAEHRYFEPDNTYLPRNVLGIETYDYLYSRSLINETKYYRILLYEWFLLVKESGYIVIEFEDNEIMDLICLRQELANPVILRDKYKLISEHADGKRRIIILQKIKSIRRPENEINQWTFGIITNGKRKSYIQKAIDSIRKLGIPEYEIILCGTYDGELERDVKYISFSEQDEKGWITKKKNLICEQAKYENIVVIHDRIYFNQDWFEGMKRYGNYFEVMSCPVLLPEGVSAKYTNWETVGRNWKREDDDKLFHPNGTLDVTDWDPDIIIAGPIIIIKRSAWQLEKWNEDLFWGEAEDIEYSLRQHKKGFMIRLNHLCPVHAFCITGIMRWIYYEKNTKKLGRRRDNFILVLILKFLDRLGVRRSQKITDYTIRALKIIFRVPDWRIQSKRKSF